MTTTHNFITNFDDGSVKDQHGNDLTLKITLDGWEHSSYNALVCFNRDGELITGDAWYQMSEEIFKALGAKKNPIPDDIDEKGIDHLNGFQCPMLQRIEHGETSGRIHVPILGKYVTFEVITDDQANSELNY